jgi:multidrug resistance efflux pump
MGKLFSIVAVLIIAVVILGVAIDVQSRALVVRSVSASQPTQIFASGRIEGSTPEIELRPQLVGQIVRVFVAEGQRVNKGDVLIQLDDRQYCQETALAEAELVLAQAKLERLVNGAHPQERNEAIAHCRAREAELHGAELSWQRIQGLLQQHSISEQEGDNYWTQVTKLRSEVEAARSRVAFLSADARTDEVRMEQAHVDATRARLELAKVQAEHTRLCAPCDAQVLKINGKVGELGSPETPVPSIILADTNKYYVRAFVEELDAPRVNLDMPASVTVDGLRGQVLRGRVARLSPRMERKSLWSDRPAEQHDTKTREVWIELEPTNPLVIGLRVEAMIDAKLNPTQAKVAGVSSPAVVH